MMRCFGTGRRWGWWRFRIRQDTGYLSGQLREVEAAARRLAVGLGCEIVDSYVESDVPLEE
jgi:hypothetical protein